MGKVRDSFRFNKFKLNRKGFALVTVLVFASAMLILSVSVYYFIIKGTKFSGSIKRYSSLKEATEGGINLGIEVVRNYEKNPSSLFSGIIYNKLKDTDNNCGFGNNSIIDFETYVVVVEPSDADCADFISGRPWIEFSSGSFEVDVHIVKVFQGPISGMGGAAAFPSQTGSNVSTYKYLFKIISIGKDVKTDSTLITESLYQLVF